MKVTAVSEEANFETILKETYGEIKSLIEKKLQEFKEAFENQSEEEIFAELSFCLLTPQSKAKVCWKAIEELKKTGLLYRGSKEEIENLLKGVRFKKNKAGYIVEARKKILGSEKEKFLKGKNFKDFIKQFPSAKEARKWLVENIKGMGMKEASHFLRNIGLGDELAILDRHILKGMVQAGALKEIPKSMSPRKYLDIEKNLKDLSEKIDIPMSHLDLLLWYMKTGEVFK